MTIRTEFRVYHAGVDEPLIQHADLAPEPTYFALRDIIKPLLNDADLEHVSVLFKGERADMFVDEIGLMKGLPRNDAATDIYRANTLARHPNTAPESLSYIAGTAILFMRRVWF